MALYRPVQSWMKASEAVKITGTETRDGFTVYVIQVTVSPYRWTAKHRYSEFKELHEKLTSCFHVDKGLLPPKKLFGNTSESFVQQRQAELEHYLQTLVHQFSARLPPALLRFLHFHKYVGLGCDSFSLAVESPFPTICCAMTTDHKLKQLSHDTTCAEAIPYTKNVLVVVTVKMPVTHYQPSLSFFFFYCLNRKATTSIH